MVKKWKQNYSPCSVLSFILDAAQPNESLHLQTSVFNLWLLSSSSSVVVAMAWSWRLPCTRWLCCTRQRPGQQAWRLVTIRLFPRGEGRGFGKYHEMLLPGCCRLRCRGWANEEEKQCIHGEIQCVEANTTCQHGATCAAVGVVTLRNLVERMGQHWGLLCGMGARVLWVLAMGRGQWSPVLTCRQTKVSKFYLASRKSTIKGFRSS